MKIYVVTDHNFLWIPCESYKIAQNELWKYHDELIDKGGISEELVHEDFFDYRPFPAYMDWRSVVIKSFDVITDFCPYKPKYDNGYFVNNDKVCD